LSTDIQKTTIIITTHYIEEARQASVVGLMRHGKLMAQDCPTSLLKRHHLETLEEVFLKLCIKDALGETDEFGNSSET
jgi:ABC-type multidrug transport system ATPase subunit